MGHRAVTAEVSVPLIVLWIQSKLRQARIEDTQALFALAAADDLADAGCQNIHRSNGLAVVIEAHIKRLHLLGIVGDDDGAANVLLGQPALVLGLQVQAPRHRELELVT